MGYRFSLILSREITDEESTLLQEAGCGQAIFGADSLPTNADVPVTKMDFDDTMSPTLAEAIESALEAVKKVPDLSVPGLTVPAQPAGGPEEPGEPGVVAGEVLEEAPDAKADTALDNTTEQASETSKAAPKETGKVTAKKTRAKKATAKKTSQDNDTAEPAEGSPITD